MRKFMREGAHLLTQVTKEYIRTESEGLTGCKSTVRMSLLQVQMLQRFAQDLKRWQSTTRKAEQHRAQRSILAKQAELREVEEDAAFEVQLIARMRLPENRPPALQLARLRDWHKYHVASQLHELWRAPRRRPVGSIPPYDPRPKVISGHTFDIANLNFDELPERWQRENVETAQYVCDAAYAQIAATGSALFDEAMLEARSSDLHDFWIARNKAWCDPALTVPFLELSKQEQEKDRAIVRAATEAFVKCPRFGPGLAPLPGFGDTLSLG